MFNVTNIIRLLTLLILFLLISRPSTALAADFKIVVSADKITGKVNPLVFGSSIMGYDPSTISKGGKKYTGYTNYGGGVWDPEKMELVPEVIALMKEAGLKIIRFPGGTGGNFYNWKNAVGSSEQRPGYLYGLNEFLKTCKEINAEVLLVLPYFTGTPQDAADLVEYLNAPHDGSNPGGGIDWASERAKYGHTDPYGVKFFELGNEVNYGREEINIPTVNPETYGKDYLEYRKSMKAVDAYIQLGAAMVNSGTDQRISAWNNKVFQIAGKSIDFLIEHTYRPNYMSNDENVDINKLFVITLNSIEHIDKYYKTLSRHFEMVTGRKNIPIAITEYNARFVQDRPFPFRHSLGAALFNAGLIQLFLKTENNILMANYHQFVNSYWGMIKNDRFMELTGDYIKRPNYYMFEMYSKHFGADLVKIENNTSGKVPEVNKNNNLLSNKKWEANLFSQADIEISDDNVAINFNENADLNFSHVRKKVPVKKNTTYLLSGFLKADKLIDNEGVGLEIQDGRGWKETHSSSSTGKVWGTTDWTYVETEYTTLSDASHILVMIRRKKGQGPVKGNVFIKDVKLTEIEEGSRQVSTLSVSASRSADKKNVYIMVLNKNIFNEIAADIDIISERKLSDTMKVWTLNGDTVWAHNEKDPNNVVINNNKIQLTDKKQINIVFPAHSLTALELGIK